MAIDHPGWYLSMLGNPDLGPLHGDDRWTAINDRFSNRIESDRLTTP
ncbi:hypothetical protein [Marivita sp.]|nr:hypothetical protein [Marivita sp.]